MNIQQLRYVVAIANSGTFREAAEKMYVSQPIFVKLLKRCMLVSRVCLFLFVIWKKSWALRFSVVPAQGLS